MARAAEKLFADRHVDPSALSVQVGFRVEVLATGLNNPSGVEADESGNIFVTEMGSPTATAYEPGRILRIRSDKTSEVIANDFVGSLTALAYYEGAFYVAEHAYSGRLYRVFEDGTRQVLVDGLPGGGDHPTSDVVVAHSERVYFGQGTRTNAGIVGRDNAWLSEYPELHDVPSKHVKLAGRNFESDSPFGAGSVSTGAFRAFGVSTSEDEIIEGSIKSSGSILRADPDGGGLELFAWGLRRPFGMSVHADGRIFCTDTGIEDRGSRRVADGHEYMWQVVEGGWYGWPDFTGGEPVTDPRFKPQDAKEPEFLLKEHPQLAPKPVVKLPAGSGMAKFDFSRSPFFGSDEHAFVALTGRMSDANAPGEHGHSIITVDISSGETAIFASNKHPGPASAHRSGGFEHPIAARFDHLGEGLLILDLGILDPSVSDGTRMLSNTGVLWRITPEEIRR